jgi:hypothetical protein
MDIAAAAGLYSIVFIIVGACLTLLVLYGIIRVAVARGMRDHHLWLEKHRPNGPQPPHPRGTVGNYFGFARSTDATN